MSMAAPRLTDIPIPTPISTTWPHPTIQVDKSGPGLPGNNSVGYVFSYSIKNVNVVIRICKIKNEFYCGFNDNGNNIYLVIQQVKQFILVMLVLELMFFIVKMASILIYANMVLLMN